MPLFDQIGTGGHIEQRQNDLCPSGFRSDQLSGKIRCTGRVAVDPQNLPAGPVKIEPGHQRSGGPGPGHILVHDVDAFKTFALRSTPLLHGSGYAYFGDGGRIYAARNSDLYQKMLKGNDFHGLVNLANELSVNYVVVSKHEYPDVDFDNKYLEYDDSAYRIYNIKFEFLLIICLTVEALSCSHDNHPGVVYNSSCLYSLDGDGDKDDAVTWTQAQALCHIAKVFMENFK